MGGATCKQAAGNQLNGLVRSLKGSGGKEKKEKEKGRKKVD